MPQLSQLALVYQSQWFWLLLVLATIYFVVGRGIISKVETTVDARDKQIATDLAAAEAKAKAGRDAEKRVAKADAEIAAKTEAAAKALADARKSALAEFERIAAEAAREIVAKLTGAKVSDEAARAAVSGALGNA